MSAEHPESVNRLVARLFGKPIVNNVHRGDLVEEIVMMALEPDWEFAKTSYEPQDLIHRATGVGMQVKNGAAVQTWGASAHPPTFSIKVPKQVAEGARLMDNLEGRRCEIYVFTWHAVLGVEADHRNPDQWQFFVVPESALPQKSSIGFKSVTKLASPVPHSKLRQAVDSILSTLPHRPSS